MAKQHLRVVCLKTHAVSETEHRTSCLTTFSQTIPVGSCQSAISNQCGRGRGGGGLAAVGGWRLVAVGG